MYWWEGRVERAGEALLVLKTARERVRGLEALLRDVHPYDTFELVVMDLSGGSAPYLAWIAGETGAGRGGRSA